MDPLTKKLIFRSGLNPTNPLLPPIHNVRMVILQKGLTQAAKDLHDARLALEALENNSTPTNRTALYSAMDKLEKQERSYLATRYFGHNKPVLQGWKQHEAKTP